jgi:hypothetical protein
MTADLALLFFASFFAQVTLRNAHMEGCSLTATTVLHVPPACFSLLI